MKYLLKHISFFGVLILIFLWGGNSLGYAQLSEPQPRFHNYTVEDGLPGTETYFVHQDKKGYIWICTDRGVARFDGYKFENFTLADGLSDNVVFKIYEDYKGRIWFLTYNSMLSYYENGKIHPYKYNHLIEKAMDAIKVAPQKMLYVDRNDKIYYALNFNGMFSIDKHGSIEKLPKGEGFIIEKMGGQLIWSFYNRIKRKSPIYPVQYSDGKHLKKISAANGDVRFSVASTAIEEFCMYNDVLFSITSQKEITREPGAIYLYTQKKTNAIWIGSFKNGIIEIPDTKHPEKYSRYLKNLSVSSVLCDNEGGYWFTTLEKGVFYTPSLAIKNYTMEQGLVDDDIISIAGIKDEVYIGFLLERWQSLRRPEFKNDVSRGNTHVLLGSSKKQFYITTSSAFRPSNNKIAKMICTRWAADYYCETTGSVICGSREVYRIFDNGKVDTLYTFSQDKGKDKRNMFQNLMSDQNGKVWLGTLTGLCYVDENRNMSAKGLNDPLFKIRVSDLMYHPAWKNIVATRGEGIYFFDNKKIFRQLKVKDGLLSDIVNCIYVDQAGGLWIGTNKGLNYITRDKGGIHIENFTTLHGLISNEISCVYVYNGVVYAGTKRGLCMLDTKLFTRNEHLSDMYVTMLETNDKKMNPFIHNVFGYEESYIKIGFRNSNYRTLKDGFYQYRFNKQSEWIVTQTPEISLINPLPGEYNLEIRYQNEDGFWSHPQLVCSFTIDTAFYNKWYFFTGIAILMILLGWWIFRVRIRQLKQRHKLNNKINQLEQKALQAQMNPHFIFNALNSIQSFLVYEENEKAEKYLLKFAQLIRQTLINSRDPYITIESEIEVLEKYLDLERMRFKEKFRYNIVSDLPVSHLSLKIPNMLIQPFVENAVIHGFSTLDSGGEISILLQPVDDNQILCIVEDNGIGRKKAIELSSQKHVSFGTTITEERLKAFETKHDIDLKIETIDIENPDGTRGTRVLINLPVINSKETND